VFLARAADGLAQRSGGRTADATERLAAAAALYSGDFLEEDPHVDWAVALREEARRMYLQVTRVLATDAADDGAHDDAVRYLLRILERDQYDEAAHLSLVGVVTDAGRHGEARRMYRSYCLRMEEIGVEPASFPSPHGHG
jgi:DNA-binding SARP family transcriptional activator